MGSWLGALVNTDFGYKQLKENGYTEEQIAPWVMRTPPPKEPTPVPQPKKVPPQGGNMGSEQGNMLSEQGNMVLGAENPLNKGSLSTGIQNTPPASNIPSSDPSSPQPQSQSLSQSLSQEQLSSLGLMRDANGKVFAVQTLSNGGYQLNPISEDQIAAQIQSKNRQQSESQLLQRISERAIDEFNINIQAIVKKAALSARISVQPGLPSSIDLRVRWGRNIQLNWKKPNFDKSQYELYGFEVIQLRYDGMSTAPHNI